MSRPQKIHPPLKGDFSNILAAIGAGTGKGKRAAKKAAAARSNAPVNKKP
jgi:hypothetical protein